MEYPSDVRTACRITTYDVPFTEASRPDQSEVDQATVTAVAVAVMPVDLIANAVAGAVVRARVTVNVQPEDMSYCVPVSSLRSDTTHAGSSWLLKYARRVVVTVRPPGERSKPAKCCPTAAPTAST